MFLDGYYKKNLDIIQEKAIPNNWDALMIFFGIEGSGKSTFAMQTAAYLDPDFNMDKVVFNPEQFEKILDSCEPESAVVWDEAITGANIAQFANNISISIISKLTQIRKKKLKIIICFPYLWMLNKYFVARCLFSVNIKAKSFSDRGYFNFYGCKSTQILYSLMKERYAYYPDSALLKIRPNFYSVFSRDFPLNSRAYDNKKEESRLDSKDVLGKNIWKERFILARDFVRNETNGKITKFSRYCKIAYQNLNNL